MEEYDPGTWCSNRTKLLQPYTFQPTRARIEQYQQQQQQIDQLPTEGSPKPVEADQVCTCGMCEEENSVSCCNYSQLIKKKIQSEETVNYVTESHSFRVVCTQEDVLEVSFKRMNVMRKKRRKEKKQQWNNAAKRWVAYSQFILWIYGEPLG